MKGIKVLLVYRFQYMSSSGKVMRGEPDKWFWASPLGAGALVLLLWLCWRTRKVSHKPESSCKQGRPGSQEEEEEEVEEDNDSSDTCNLGKFLANCIQWSVPYMADTCKLVEGLVDKFLSACQSFSRSNFKPQLHPAIGMGCVYEGSAREDNVLYHLLMLLQPLPGHTFCLELDTAEKMLTNDSCLQVQLQLICIREQLVEDILCFLHHYENEPKGQNPSLLNILYTNSFLNIKKAACWFQMLLKDTWKVMCQSHHCQLTLLPTTRSCMLKLVNASKETLYTEMIFVVQLDDSDSFLSLEYTEASFTTSTAWQKGCDVAEMQFTRHGQHNTFHPRSNKFLQQK
ncbi:LOW QUALITY PROTEIN: inositol 1,4,5-trisphosphate receptor-interacting protein-like 1 [Pluvialis apricaria]